MFGGDKKILIFDIESNGFKPTKIHVLSYCDYSEVIKGNKKPPVISLTNREEIIGAINNADIIVGHYITLFDVPVLQRLLGIDIFSRADLQIIDTWILSEYLYPKQEVHSLDYYGDFFNLPKVPIDDWENLPLETYVGRCEQDVRINTNLFFKLLKDFEELYQGDWVAIDRMIRYLCYIVDCYREFAEERWKVDIPKLNSNIEELSTMWTEKKEEFEKLMQPIPKYGTRKYPAKMFKKDGALSADGLSYTTLRQDQGLPDDYAGDIKYVNKFEPPNAASPKQVKEFLFSIGWEPDVYKFEKDEFGNERKIPQITKLNSPELSESVLFLAEEYDSIKVYDGLNSIKARMNVLNKIKELMSEDGYVIATMQGITNTLRVRHTSPLVNLPGADKPYGQYVRSVLSVEEGYVLCGADLSSLESRTRNHFLKPLDPEYVLEMEKKDYDPHLALAQQDGKLNEEEVRFYKDYELDPSPIPHTPENVEEYKRIKKIRHVYKTANYSLVYGAGPPSVARATKISLKDAKKLVDTYRDQNWAQYRVSEQIERRFVLGVRWILNPVNGLWYWLKAEKDVFSTLNQSTGSYVFFIWMANIRRLGVRLCGSFHDEKASTCIDSPKNKEHRKKLIKHAIKLTNKQLKLNVSIDCEIKFGHNYADVH